MLLLAYMHGSGIVKALFSIFSHQYIIAELFNCCLTGFFVCFLNCLSVVVLALKKKGGGLPPKLACCVLP